MKRPQVADHLGIAAAVGFGALLFMSVALYNRFPLAYFDLGDYLNGGFNPIGLTLRPIFYGLFIVWTGGGYSLWLPVLVQSLMLAGLIFGVFRILSPHQGSTAFVVMVAALTFTTGIAFVMANLVPDAVTAMVALSAVIVFFARGKVSIAAGCAVLIFSLSSHYTHVLILTPCLLAVAAGRFLGASVSWRRISLVAGCVAATLLISMSWNAKRGLGFRPTSTSGVFSLRPIQLSGNLADYLENVPEAKNCSLYPYRELCRPDSDHIIWNEKGYVMRTRRFFPPNDYANIFYGAVRRDPIRFLNHVFVFGIRQYRHFIIVDDAMMYPKEQIPMLGLERHVPGQMKNFEASRQQQGTYHPWAGFRIVHKAAALLSLLGLIVLFLVRRKDWRTPLWQATGFILAYTVFNAFVCGGLAEVADRFQGRVVWLLVFLFLIHLHRLWRASRNDPTVRHQAPSLRNPVGSV